MCRGIVGAQLGQPLLDMRCFFQAKWSRCSYFLVFYTCLLAPFCICTSVSEVCRRSASIKGTKKKGKNTPQRRFGDSNTNAASLVLCVCVCMCVQVSRRASCMTDGGPIDCSQSSRLPAKIGPLARSGLAQLICHRAGQNRLHKLHRPMKPTCCVLKPVLPLLTAH